MTARASNNVKRLLVTGARNHTDVAMITAQLTGVLNEWNWPLNAVLVEGECPYGGADLIAHDFWHALGLPVEKHPAEIAENGRILGPARNQRMVDSGADLCLAFPLEGSRGTWDCVRRAEAAGIEVRVIKP